MHITDVYVNNAQNDSLSKLDKRRITRLPFWTELICRDLLEAPYISFTILFIMRFHSKGVYNSEIFNTPTNPNFLYRNM